MPSHPHKGKYSFVQGPSLTRLSSIQVISLLQEMKNNGIKIKNMGAKILKKTIKELDYFISDDFKKT